MYTCVLFAGCSALSPDSGDEILAEWKFLDSHLDVYMLNALESMSIRPLSLSENALDSILLRLVVSSNWGREAFTISWKITDDTPGNGWILIEWVDVDTDKRRRKQKSLTYIQIREIEKQLRMMRNGDLRRSPPVKIIGDSETVSVDGSLVLFEYLKNGIYRYSINADASLRENDALANLLALVAGIANAPQVD